MPRRSRGSARRWRRTGTDSICSSLLHGPRCADRLPMKVTPTELPDVLLLEPQGVRRRPRIFLRELQSRARSPTRASTPTFVQDNHSRSARGVLRGLHYQIEHAQGKLVRVIAGEVFDVAVDLRRSSPRFGRSVGVDAVGGEPPHAVDPARVRARLPGRLRRRGIPLQDDRLLVSASTSARCCGTIRRSAIAWPLSGAAGRRGQGRGRRAAGRRPTSIRDSDAR